MQEKVHRYYLKMAGSANLNVTLEQQKGELDKTEFKLLNLML